MMGRIAALVVAAVLTGASLLPARGLSTTLDGGEGYRALPVSLEDETGLVIGIATSTSIVSTDSAMAVPGRANALQVGWLGGACDRSAVFTLRRDAQRFLLDLRVPEEDHCTLQGISRSLVIETIEPIDPASVTPIWNLLYSAKGT